MYLSMNTLIAHCHLRLGDVGEPGLSGGYSQPGAKGEAGLSIIESKHHPYK
jgi:hypothetical protein